MEAKKRTPSSPSYAPTPVMLASISAILTRNNCILYTVFSRNPARVPVHRSLLCFPSFPASLLAHTTALPVDA